MIKTLGQDIAYTQLSIKTKRSILGQLLFISIALILPTITHKVGLNFLTAQPMHWMVLFAGLTYGMLSGAIAGLAIPILSHYLSGMPILAVLPLMIPELMLYGFVAGLLKRKCTSFGSVLIALIFGKIGYMILALCLGKVNVPIITFISTVWTPSLLTMIAQIIVLPLLSGLFINWIKTDEK